jgi:competence protein ComEC
MLRFFAFIDRGRNQLAGRVSHVIDGPSGAIAAAMVTGKRDFLDDPTREIIRQAGIFHIITIAGVQMTLVAGIFFVGFRRLLALSRTLALYYPIKKWAAGAAMCAAIFYDIATGSRIGTERALIMTLVMLGAIISDRTIMSLRNLALAMWIIILCEPEALLGVSFQLSFAAVAGLIVAYEFYAKNAYKKASLYEQNIKVQSEPAAWDGFIDVIKRGPWMILFSTLCASLATVSYMAYHFHEVSPYVIIGNPLTLAMIEFFAVPAALVGSLLYPFGLDLLVWHYLSFGINLVLWIASHIASWQGATLYLHAFAPISILFLSFALFHFVIWSGWLRLLGVPFLWYGLYQAFYIGLPFDVVIPPNADAIAFRAEDGKLIVMGRSVNRFAVEQWLRADGDGRDARDVVALSDVTVGRLNNRGIALSDHETEARARAHYASISCDKSKCQGTMSDGRVIELIYEPSLLANSCREADILISPLFAPRPCLAPIVIDRRYLNDHGAVMLRTGEQDILIGDRGVDEDRPWSPQPQRDWRDHRVSPVETTEDQLFDADENEPLK